MTCMLNQSAVTDKLRVDAPAQEVVKKQIDIGPHTHFRGYQALGANVTRYEGGFQRDWHEAIDLYKEADPDTPAVSFNLS